MKGKIGDTEYNEAGVYDNKIDEGLTLYKDNEKKTKFTTALYFVFSISEFKLLDKSYTLELE